MPFARLKITLILLFSLIVLIHPSSVKAAESCTATVSVSSIETNSQGPFSFSVTNTGDVDIIYVKVTRPSDNFSLYNVGIPGWTAGVNSSTAEIYGGTVSPAGTFNFNLGVNVGANEASAANWIIKTIASGSLVGCTGSLGTAVTGVGDVTAPVMSSLAVSGITSSSVTISWTTDESSDSYLNYGPSFGNYTTNLHDTGLSTSHSFTLTGLSANTTYYYEYRSVDSSGNAAVYSDFHTFTTSASSSTDPTATPTTTTTVATPTPTPTPSPTPPPVDRTPPRATITTDFDEPFEEVPLIKGRASDNKIVTAIEYSTDGGNNWLPVDEIEDIGSSKTDFEFTPFLNEDGNYPIQVRVKDKRGNIGRSKEIILVIDRLPPLIGGNLISLGPQALMPNSDGTVIALAGIEQKITLSAVGGPIEIDLFVGDKKIPLEYSAETSLWSGFLNLDKVGVYTITAKAIDGAENKTQRDLNQIQVIKSGQIIDPKTNESIKKGKITIFAKDNQTELWNKWDAKAFSQENPQNLDDNNGYQLFLPPGTYYFKIESAGFSTLKSQIFTLNESRPINSDFILESGRAFQIGPFKLALPPFLQETIEVDLSLSEVKNLGNNSSSLLNQIAPSFSLENSNGKFQLSSLRGKNSIISFISTWSPPAIEQISIINQLVETEGVPIIMISTQETIPKLEIFGQRGNYTTPIWADPDGELIEKYQITTLPTHLILDRKGKITKVLTQVLNKEQLLALLSDTN